MWNELDVFYDFSGKSFESYEGTDSTDKSLLSSNSVYKIDPSEI